jgi:hypothetical protein
MKPCQPQINQSIKQKREKQGTTWQDLHPRRQMNHPREQTTRGTVLFN